MIFFSHLWTWFTGELVGVDHYGNRYYRNTSARASDGRERRLVLYKGLPEASKVPPEWHIWLHHTTDVPLIKGSSPPWQKGHMPNLTGTPNRYLPSRHDERGDFRAKKVTGDYEAWHPE